MKHYQFMRTDRNEVVEFNLELGAVSTRHNVIALFRKQDQRTRPSNFARSGSERAARIDNVRNEVTNLKTAP